MDFTPDQNALLEEARTLLRSQDLGVLATSAPGSGPHMSLMAYAVLPGEDAVCMLTNINSRKAANLRIEARVGLLVDTRPLASDRAAIRALSVTGKARLLEKGQEYDRLRSLLLERIPSLADFTATQDTAVILLRAESYLLLRGISDATFLRLGKTDHA
ncbi:MAG: pyridoxamine 5'-phosphate oxidase family protein [Desulfovibrionaceae bacterium]